MTDHDYHCGRCGFAEATADGSCCRYCGTGTCPACRDRCSECGGSGRVPDGTFGCQQCGVDSHSDCYNSNQAICPRCDGTGRTESPSGGSLPLGETKVGEVVEVGGRKAVVTDHWVEQDVGGFDVLVSQVRYL